MNLKGLWQIFNKPKPGGSNGSTDVQAVPHSVEDLAASPVEDHAIVRSGVNFSAGDPIIEYFQHTPGVVEIDKLELDSTVLRELKASGVKLAVPLVSQGELIGLLNLGPRLSEQEYSADDYSLLNNLAIQAAPALRVAQLARQQQAEAQQRERLEHEMQVARLIQQTLLPKQLPSLSGWSLSAYYQPARAVGGDFYDYIHLRDGRLGLVIGDVTDKGVPAALVMATTRSILRSSAEQCNTPGEVLERSNDLLCPDIPEKMFVTCLYAILDPATGRIEYANAGHDLPYRHKVEDVDELRATGMPLGLMPGMHYEQKEVTLAPGECVLFYSDGLVEAHNRQGDMFGFPRLKMLVGSHPGGKEMIPFLLGQLGDFTGAGWEQEDDVTLLILKRMESDMADPALSAGQTENASNGENAWRVLAEFSVPSAPGNERQVMEQVAQAVSPLKIPQTRLERLKTAVAEATMNAMEHGNHYREDQPVVVRVQASPKAVSVSITDHGSGEQIPQAETPDIEAKLLGLQTPRGWGLFLIKNMVDGMNVNTDERHHTVELILNREGE